MARGGGGGGRSGGGGFSGGRSSGGGFRGSSGGRGYSGGRSYSSRPSGAHHRPPHHHHTVHHPHRPPHHHHYSSGHHHHHYHGGSRRGGSIAGTILTNKFITPMIVVNKVEGNQSTGSGKISEDQVIVPMEEFLVNLAKDGEKKTEYMRITMSVLTNSEEDSLRRK